MSSNRIPMTDGRRPPMAEVCRAGEALFLLGLARLAIRFLPFHALMRHLVRKGGRGGSEERLPQVRQAVVRAARRAPFRAKCFEQALAAHWMLRRRSLSTTVHYGLSNREGRLRAHVWLRRGPVVVVGEEAMGEFSEVASWPS